MIWLLLSGLLALSSGELMSSDLPPQFTDVAQKAGIEFVNINGERAEKRYLFEAKGAGLGFFDFDNDGWLDLLFVQGSTMDRFLKDDNPSSTLYRNNQDGTFTDVTKAAGLVEGGWGMGVASGDYNNDGFVDLYVTQLEANVLYRNNGDGTFTDVTAKAGVGGSSWSSSAAFGDYDADGHLDLYVCNYIDMDPRRPPEPGSAPFCNYRGRPGICGPLGLTGAANVLYRNNGDGTFSDVTVVSGVREPVPYFSLGAVWSDIDNDRDLDLFVGNDSTPNFLFVNQGKGKFLEKGFLSGLAASGDGGFQASMGIDVADYNNDGLLDVFSTHFANDYSTLYRNRGNLLFEDVTNETQFLQAEWLLVSWGTRMIDLNHDGWKDIFHTNGHVYPFLLTAGWTEQYPQPSSLYLNRRDGAFFDASKSAGPDLQKPTVSRGAAFGDFDNDGDIDCAVTNLNDSPQLLRNEGVAGGNWIMFRTRGRESNRDGLGTRISISAGGLEQVWEIKRTVGIYSSSDPRAHFGLGGARQVDSLEIRWPSGKVQHYQDVPAGVHYLLDENEGLKKEF
jgi:hypothetical protein